MLLAENRAACQLDLGPKKTVVRLVWPREFWWGESGRQHKASLAFVWGIIFSILFNAHLPTRSSAVQEEHRNRHNRHSSKAHLVFLEEKHLRQC